MNAKLFLPSFYEIERDGDKFAWVLSPMAGEDGRGQLAENEGVARFASHETARAYAEGWIRRNRPDLLAAAKREAALAAQYAARNPRGEQTERQVEAAMLPGRGSLK